jgi:hypothetical protein
MTIAIGPSNQHYCPEPAGTMWKHAAPGGIVMQVMLKSTLVAGGVLLAASTPSLAAGQIVSRLQNVPNSTTVGSDLVQGDEWTFKGNAGAVVLIRLDTRDDTGRSESLLDPVLVLKGPSGRVVSYNDDGFACSVTPVCGFACPEIRVRLPVTGTYRIVARDFDSASITDAQCTGGSYLLQFQSAPVIARSLSKGPMIDNGIVGDPPALVERLRREKGG